MDADEHPAELRQMRGDRGHVEQRLPAVSDQTTRCGCGQPATVVIVMYGCIVEKCRACATALCDPLGRKDTR